MFLPNSNSFLLVRSAIPKPVIQPAVQESATRRKMFLPNTDSFLLRRSIVGHGLPSEVAPPVRSFASNGVNVTDVIPQSVESTDSEQPKVKDHSKRNFLKVASIASASLAGALFLPKKAEALIMGSSPTTGVVGIKNVANTRINPAREETVSSLATEATVATLATQATASLLLKTTDLDFDAGGALEVDVVNLALPPSASTETTLQTISFGGFKFALRLATKSNNSNIDYVGEAVMGTADDDPDWRIKEINSSSGITIKWAQSVDGTGLFDQVWEDRELGTYV